MVTSIGSSLIYDRGWSSRQYISVCISPFVSVLLHVNPLFSVIAESPISPRHHRLYQLMSTIMDPHLKKRKRTTIVCNVCKSRKVRCDRKSPCSSCIKHRTSYLCSYDESPFPSDADQLPPPPHRYLSLHYDPNSMFLVPTTAASVLSQFSDYNAVVAVNPIANDSDTIDFYCGFNSMSHDPYTSEQMNNGPLSWQALVRVDGGLADLWNFILDNKPGKPYKSSSIFSTPPPPDLDDGGNIPLRVLDRIRKHLEQKFDPNNARLNLRNIPLGLTFHDPNSKNPDIGFEGRLLGILPTKDILWSHVDRFFCNLYPFYPFLDENDFRAALTERLGPVEYSATRVALVSIKSKLDVTYVGILCLVLRMSYLSLISNDIKENQALFGSGDPQSLLSSPIGIEFVDFARLCLNQHQISSRSSLATLQLFVFTRIYMEIAPEDTDGPGRDMFLVNNGMLLQMAYSIGLNREPANMVDAAVFSAPRENSIRRKLWWYIQSKDYINACKFGTPFTMSMRFSDTRFPFIDETNGNDSHGNDALILLALQPVEKLLRLTRGLLEKVLSLEKPISMGELVGGLNQLEAYLFENFGTMKDFAACFHRPDDHSTLKTLQLQLYIPTVMLIMLCYHRIFLKYEADDNKALSFFYLKKIVVFLSQEGTRYANDMLEKPHPRFGWAFHMANNSYLEYFLHRLIGLFSAIVARLGHQIVGSPTSLKPDHSIPIHHEPRTLRLKYLMRSLARNGLVCLLGMYKINHRYCYAWRIATTFTYIIRTLVSEGFYRHEGASDTQKRIGRIDFADEQISDLIECIQGPIKNLDMSVFRGYWKTVLDIIGLNSVNKRGLQQPLFDPSETDLVYAGVPDNLQFMDNNSGASVPPETNPPGDLSLMINPLGDFMGTFFGPDAYFETFSNGN